jgi:hypothetical protein
MIRKILAVVLGVVAGGIVIGVSEAIAHTIYPVPAGLDPSKPEMIAEYIRTAPLGALIAVLISWALGALVAGVVATLIARVADAKSALIAGGVLLLFSLINMFVIPHPVWFRIAGILLFLPLAGLGYVLVKPRSAASQSAS